MKTWSSGCGSFHHDKKENKLATGHAGTRADTEDSWHNLMEEEGTRTITIGVNKRWSDLNSDHNKVTQYRNLLRVGEQKELHVSSAGDHIPTLDILVFYFHHRRRRRRHPPLPRRTHRLSQHSTLLECFLFIIRIHRPSCRLTSLIVVILRLLQQS